jgi:hypothetical protein
MKTGTFTHILTFCNLTVPFSLTTEVLLSKGRAGTSPVRPFYQLSNSAVTKLPRKKFP